MCMHACMHACAQAERQAWLDERAAAMEQREADAWAARTRAADEHEQRAARVDAENRKKMAQGDAVMRKRASTVEARRQAANVWQSGGNLLGSSASTLSLVSMASVL